MNDIICCFPFLLFLTRATHLRINQVYLGGKKCVIPTAMFLLYTLQFVVFQGTILQTTISNDQHRTSLIIYHSSLHLEIAVINSWSCLCLQELWDVFKICPCLLIPTQCQLWSQSHFYPHLYLSQQRNLRMQAQITNFKSLLWVADGGISRRVDAFPLPPLKKFSKICNCLSPLHLGEKKNVYIPSLVAFKASNLHKREVLNRSGKGQLSE